MSEIFRQTWKIIPRNLFFNHLFCGMLCTVLLENIWNCGRSHCKLTVMYSEGEFFQVHGHWKCYLCYLLKSLKTVLYIVFRLANQYLHLVNRISYKYWAWRTFNYEVSISILSIATINVHTEEYCTNIVLWLYNEKWKTNIF